MHVAVTIGEGEDVTWAVQSGKDVPKRLTDLVRVTKESNWGIAPDVDFMATWQILQTRKFLYIAHYK